ncbi:MAG: hypothetical protein LBK25_07225 [Treponema sp.]|nr:hypothetical protein [Treponema sp.]
MVSETSPSVLNITSVSDITCFASFRVIDRRWCQTSPRRWRRGIRLRPPPLVSDAAFFGGVVVLDTATIQPLVSDIAFQLSV